MQEPKLCECGCGQETGFVRFNDHKRGRVAGTPLRFVPGHQSRGRKWDEGQKSKFVASMTGRQLSEQTRLRIAASHRAAGIRPPADAALSANLRRPSGPESLAWKGGTSWVNGYKVVFRPDHPRSHANGYVYEHILIAEETLGRPLSEMEVVHHDDRDKRNNSPENLIVMASQSEHLKLHREAGDLS